MHNILDRITYKPGYSFEFNPAEQGFGPAQLRVQLYAACTVTGREEWQLGRWFVVEDPDDEREVVRTAYQALYLFELHEFQENFKYDGNTVFDPHSMNLPGDEDG